MINTRCSTSSYSPTYSIVLFLVLIIARRNTWYVHFSTDLFLSFRFVPFRFANHSKLYSNVVLLPCWTQRNLARQWYDKRTALVTVSDVESNSVVSKIERSAAGNDFSLAQEEHAVVLLPWRDMARPALPSALSELIRETFKRHGTVVLQSI